MASILTGDATLLRTMPSARRLKTACLLSLNCCERRCQLPAGSPSMGISSLAGFQDANGYGVQFLTSNRGSNDNIDQPAKMPVLCGASADPLRILDFLIIDVTKTNGVLRVQIPSRRQALHTFGYDGGCLLTPSESSRRLCIFTRGVPSRG
ncbi:GSU2403 family nucleotidyltransferase fold protein [Rhizobium tumorigenes]|uniref:GSU2403 family nucleotidyltransferase fold protein n=1 Tax=Rhizobium tumorigenes TaxID=2041385 RepID=UPI0012B698FD